MRATRAFDIYVIFQSSVWLLFYRESLNTLISFIALNGTNFDDDDKLPGFEKKAPTFVRATG